MASGIGDSISEIVYSVVTVIIIIILIIVFVPIVYNLAGSENLGIASDLFVALLILLGGAVIYGVIRHLI